MKDLFVLYNVRAIGWITPQGTPSKDVQDAKLFKYGEACDMVEKANQECGPDDVPWVLMAKA